MAEKQKSQSPNDQGLTAEFAKMRKCIQMQFQEITRAMEKFLANMDEASKLFGRENKEKLKATASAERNKFAVNKEQEKEREKEKEKEIQSRPVRPRETPEEKGSEKNRNQQSGSQASMQCPKFYLKRDLRPYKPEEIKVKIEANSVSIRAKHVEKNEKGTACSEYVEQVAYPKGIDGSKVTSKLTPEGFLIIEATNDKNRKL